MALKLKKRELPTVSFRRVLPQYLGPEPQSGEKIEECFIAFEARAGGAINPVHVEMTEKFLLAARVMSRKANRITDDEEFIAADHANAEEINLQRFRTLYEACVISWDCNIQVEDDKGNTVNIVCNKENFMALVDEPIPELASAILDFEKEVNAAGALIKEDDDNTIKN